MREGTTKMEDVIIFGIGQFYKNREKDIKKIYNIVAYLDNRVEKGSTIKQDNICAYNPCDIHSLPKVDILIMSWKYMSMYQQLIELHVASDRIVFGIMINPELDRYKNILQENGRLYGEGRILKYSSNSVDEMIIESEADLEEYAYSLLRKKVKSEIPLISYLSEMPIKPVSDKFGLERGSAIDRYYIEKFLEENKKYITGNCIEIAENTYTLQFGQETKSYILHVEGWGQNAIKGNLETGEGIQTDFFDCAILTQTLMFTYSIENVAKNIYKMLKQGGTALVTVSGISPISKYDEENWGSYYSFHKDAMKKLFAPVFGLENVQVESYGNVKTAICLLYGLCFEDLKEEDFRYNDDSYPVIITVVLRKV